jgi:hypothetical protein
MCKSIEAKLAKEAQKACKDDYECFLAMAHIQYENNRIQVCKAYNKKLNNKRKAYKAQIEQEKVSNAAKLVQLKANTKAVL